MDWFATVDIYCERVGTGFWAEPVNALSNLAFPVAALWAAGTAMARTERSAMIWIPIALAASIGLGSFLFHTVANRWSELADTGPIWTFVALYILAVATRMRGRAPSLPTITALVLGALAVVVFLATGEGGANVGTAPPPSLLNGSAQYAPALAALVICAVLMARSAHPLRGWIYAATGVFLVSLIARTLDMRLCDSLPLGTHFLWHLLNALMVGLLLQLLIRAAPQVGLAPEGDDRLDAHKPARP